MISVRWLILTCMVLWVATCGQKGPLELPEGRHDAALRAS